MRYLVETMESRVMEILSHFVNLMWTFTEKVVHTNY
jgi:hypothetical protein